ncbi:MAG: hypothetical protein H7X89_15725, partial [Rhizobiales bacterium]|nr:hypothetical protein [Hyphomicrobiales bacterium]
MFSVIRAFGKDRHGSLAIITALCAPALFAVLGVAIDCVMMTNIKSRLQAAADAAALASVKELGLAGATKNQVKAVAFTFAYNNLDEDPSSKASPDSDSSTVKVEVLKEKGTVEVVIEKRWTPFFLHFVGNKVTPIRVNARARIIGRRLACVVGLSK